MQLAKPVVVELGIVGAAVLFGTGRVVEQVIGRYRDAFTDVCARVGWVARFARAEHHRRRGGMIPVFRDQTGECHDAWADRKNRTRDQLSAVTVMDA